MSEYSISTIFPIIYSAIAAVLLALYSIWTYKRLSDEISSSRRWILTSLRAIAFALLLLVLSGPILNALSTEVQSPAIDVYIDKSLSMVSTDQNQNSSIPSNKEQYNKLLTQLPEDNDINYHLFSDRSYEIAYDSIKSEADGEYTNLENVIQELPELFQSNNTRAAVIISDGNINQGRNPLLEAKKLKVPLYIVGIGDTSTSKNLSVKALEAPREVAKNSVIPLSVTVEWSGFPLGKYTASLYRDSNLVFEKQLTIDKPNGSSNLDYSDLALEDGTYKYSVKIDTIEGEENSYDNSSSVYVSVKTLKRQISLFAGAPSSDVSFLTNTLKNIADMEVSKFIQKKGGDFYNEPTEVSLRESDAIVLIDFPNQFTTDEVLSRIKGLLDKDIPMLFIAGRSLDWGKLKQLERYIPFTVIQSNRREYQTQIKPSTNLSANTLMGGEEIDFTDWLELPPIFKTETFVKPKPGTNIIAKSYVNGQEMNDPLIIANDKAGAVTIAVLGYGLYNWKLKGYALEKAIGNEAVNLYDQFVSNAIGFLSVKDKSKKFKIETDKTSYTKNDAVSIKAQVLDEALRPINNASVKVKLSGGEGLERELQLSNSGYGAYSQTISGLAPGDYKITGSAEVDGVLVGAGTTAFTILNTQLELTQKGMNVSLLKSLADYSGGRFYMPDEMGSMWEDIKEASSFRSRSREQRSSSRIWDWTFILILTILILSSEWFLRKRWGLL